MEEKKVHVHSGGLSVSSVVGIVFVVLKLVGVINWSWWWVTAPFWGPIALTIGLGAVCLAGYGITKGIIALKDLIEEKSYERNYVKTEFPHLNRMNKKELKQKLISLSEQDKELSEEYSKLVGYDVCPYIIDADQKRNKSELIRAINSVEKSIKSTKDLIKEKKESNKKVKSINDYFNQRNYFEKQEKLQEDEFNF